MSKTLYLVKNQAAAEEIVQEVFLKLWKKKIVFEELRSAYAWVYKSCTNAAIDFIRKKSNEVMEYNENNEQAEPMLSTEQKLELQQLCKKLIHQLSEQEAEVFVYRNVEGLNQEEIAEVLGVSRRTVIRICKKVDEKLSKYKERLNE